MSHQIHRAVASLLILLTLSACAAPGLPAQDIPPTPASPVVQPTAAPTAAALAADVRSELGGFSLRYPQGWATREMSGTLEVAANKAALDTNALGETLVLRVESAPLDVLSAQYGAKVISDTNAFFSASTANIKGVNIGAPEPTSVAGRPGLAADIFSGENAQGRVVTVLGEQQGVRVLAQSSPATWPTQRDLFDRMIQSMTFFAPPPPPTATPSPDQATQPRLLLAKDAGSAKDAGFVLRLGGNEGTKNERFASARGLAAAADGTVYLAESGQGVWVFAPDGTFKQAFGKGELLDAYDVALGPDGTIYVADFGRNAITRFTPDGKLAGRWGESGDQPGQFGLLAPQRIAAGPDGTVYALDSRVQSDNSTVSKVLRFKGVDGSFLGAIDLPSGSSPNDLAVDRDNNLYLAEPFGGVIVKIDGSGKVLARLGEKASAQGLKAGSIDLDANGNIYVATWGDGILELAPSGALLMRGGAVAKENSVPQPGEFNLPNGIAVAGGGVVWVSDNSGEYSAVTALRLVTNILADPTAQAQATADALANATATPPRAAARSWASSATASSQYDDNYAAKNVVGAPDVPGCASGPGSWASSDPQGKDSLEVRFADPLFATSINIYQNHEPGYIVKVELLDERGVATTAYDKNVQPSVTQPISGTTSVTTTQVVSGTATVQSVATATIQATATISATAAVTATQVLSSTPTLAPTSSAIGTATTSGTCPQVLTVSFPQTLFRITGAKISLDQSGGASWNEIDAVELVGVK